MGNAWPSATFRGARGRQNAVYLVLGLILVAGLVWALPVRRWADGGSTGRGVSPADPFERAGVTELHAGQRGPEFRLPRYGGGEASLETWRDRLIVLNFWATWCGPCTIEMPALEALWREYRDRGLVVVGISVDRGAPESLLEPYLHRLDLTFPILLDPELEVANAWRVTGIPATFVIRPGGDVVGMAFGPREWSSAEMQALLETLLPGVAAAPAAR